MDLANNGSISAAGLGGNCGSHTGQSGADHQDIMLQHGRFSSEAASAKSPT
jgi:hypothetical protein